MRKLVTLAVNALLVTARACKDELQIIYALKQRQGHLHVVLSFAILIMSSFVLFIKMGEELLQDCNSSFSHTERLIKMQIRVYQ